MVLLPVASAGSRAPEVIGIDRGDSMALQLPEALHAYMYSQCGSTYDTEDSRVDARRLCGLGRSTKVDIGVVVASRQALEDFLQICSLKLNHTHKDSSLGSESGSIYSDSMTRALTQDYQRMETTLKPVADAIHVPTSIVEG